MTAAAGLSTTLADRYPVERELDQGGIASVYLAADKPDRKVAFLAPSAKGS